MSDIELVVLDMAGTTVRDDGVVLQAFVAAAEACGLEATEEELNARMGLSKVEVFDELARRQLGSGAAAEALRDRGFELFREVLEGYYEKYGAQAVAGAEQVFTWCRDRRICVALNTGFYRRVTDLLVSTLGWQDAVDVVVCVDDVPTGRPAPYMIHSAMQLCGARSVDAVVVVGDTPSDMRAGRAAGARAVVGVTSGAHTAATLRREPLTHLLDGVWQLPELVERIERLRHTIDRSSSV